MKRSIVTLVLILIMSGTFTACWDRKEVDKLAIVIGLGIDKISGTDPILLTAQIVNPSSMQKDGGSRGQEEPFVVTMARGSTVYDAVRNFAKDSPRRMYFSHNSIIVIGDRMARSGIQDILDYFERDPQFRRTSWMLVTPKTAKEILEAKLDLQKLSAIGVKDMIKEFHQSSAVKVVQRKDFMSDLTSKSASAVASRIELIEEAAIVERNLKKDEGGESRELAGYDKKGEQKKQLRLSGNAIFRRDKLAGYFDDAESRGLLWVLGEVRGGAVVTSCPSKEKGTIVFRINTTKQKMVPSFAGDQLNMLLEINEESVIEEVNCGGVDISKPETIKELEELQDADVEERIMATVRRAQMFKSDVVKFGEAFRRKDPKRWKTFEKEWAQHFSKVKVTVHVTSKIRRVGMTSKPVEVGN